MIRKHEESFFICGDAPDPTGATKAIGKQQGLDLTKSAVAHPVFRYRDRIVECDLYEVPGAPAFLHLYCPRCNVGKGDSRALRISQGQKRFELHGDNTISIERFACTWCGSWFRVERGQAVDFEEA